MKSITITEEEKNNILLQHRLIVETVPPGGNKGAKKFIATTGLEPIYKMIDNMLFRQGDEASLASMKQDLKLKFGDDMTEELKKLALKKGDNLKEFIEATIKKIENLAAKEGLIDESEKALKSLLEKMEKGYGEKMTKEEVENFTTKVINESVDDVVNKKTTGGIPVVDGLIDNLVNEILEKSETDASIRITEKEIEENLREALSVIYGGKIPQEVLDGAMGKLKNSQKYKDAMTKIKSFIEVNAEKSADEINQELEKHGLPLSDKVAELPFLAKVQYWLKVASTSDNWLLILFQYVRPDEWVRITREYYRDLALLGKNLIEKGRGNEILTEKDFHKKLTRIREIMNGMKEVATKEGLNEKQKERLYKMYYSELESEIRLIKEYKTKNEEGRSYIDQRVYEIYDNIYKALKKGSLEDPNDKSGAVTIFKWFTERVNDTGSKISKLEELISSVVKAKKDKANTGFWEDTLGFLFNFKKSILKENEYGGFEDDSSNIKWLYERINKWGDYEIPKPTFSYRPDRLIIWFLGQTLSPLGKGIQLILKNAGNLIFNYARTGIFTSPKFMQQMYLKYGYPKGLLVLIVRWVALYNIILPVLTSLRDAIYILTQYIISLLPTEMDGISFKSVGYLTKVIMQTILYCFAISPIDTVAAYIGIPQAEIELATFQDELEYTRVNYGKEFYDKVTNGLLESVPKILGTLVNPTGLGDFIKKSIAGAKIGINWYMTGSVKREDIDNLIYEWNYFQNPSVEFITREIFDIKLFLKTAFENEELFELNELNQELERIKKEALGKANAEVEKLLDDSTKVLLNAKLQEAIKKIATYKREPRDFASDLSSAEFITLTERGFLTFNPNYRDSLTGNETEDKEAQLNIQRLCRDNAFSNTNPKEAPIGVLVGKVFYPYVDDYSILSQNESKIITFAKNNYEPHFYDAQNDKFISLRKMAVDYLKTDAAKVQESVTNQLKTESLMDDLEAVTLDLVKRDNNIKELLGISKNGDGGRIELWTLELIRTSIKGAGKIPKPGMRYQFELAYNSLRDTRNKAKDLITKTNETIGLLNQYLEKFTTWAYSKGNTNATVDQAKLKALLTDLEQKDLEYQMVEKEVQSGVYTIDNTGKKTHTLHKIMVPVISPFEYLTESINKKQNIIKERYLLGNRNMRSRYIFEDSDEKRFGENKFDHWYDTFTFQKYDEKSNEFKDIETDSLKHGKIKERFNDFIKNYDGDDAFVRAVVDTHPEVVRFKYLKNQANIQETYYPTGLASLLSIIRESKGEYEIFSVSRQKGGNWNLVKGEFTQKEMSNMVLTKQIPPEKKPKERENGLVSLKKKEESGTGTLRTDEVEGIKDLPKKLKEKIREKIQKGWTTEIPPKVFHKFYEESEISSVFNDEIIIYKLQATPEFFKSLEKNSSHVLIKRGFCRSLLFSKNDSDITDSQRKVVRHLLMRCHNKFEGKYGVKYMSKIK